MFVILTASRAEDGNVYSKNGLVGMKPLLIHMYNQFIGGVDNSEKSIYHTSCSHKVFMFNTQKVLEKKLLEIH